MERTGTSRSCPNEEGTVALDLRLSKVVYVLVDHEEHRVGLGI
jgi:hypothetical protein